MGHLLDDVLLITNLGETIFRVYWMAGLGMYTSPDAIQLTILTLSLTPIFILRSCRPQLSKFALPYATILCALQLNEGVSNPGRSTVNVYNLVLCSLEILCAVVVPKDSIRRRLPSLQFLQVFISVGFWGAMVVVSQLEVNTTFMRLDRNMSLCGLDLSCWLEDEERYGSFLREFFGHFIIQMIAYFTIKANDKGYKGETDRVNALRGFLELIVMWTAIVAGSALASGGNIPYFSPSANPHK